MACALTLALVSSLTLAEPGQARKKDGSRRAPREGSRQLQPPEVTTGTEVSLAFGRKLVRAGDRVQITVRIDRGENVAHVPFHLSYDPAVLRFEGSEEGSFLSGDGEATVFLASPASAGSAVVVGLSRLGRMVGAHGKGVLCTLEFTAVGPGDANLTFARASVRDAENHALTAEFRSPRLVVR